jgi:flagellar biosynthesis component FlhA
MVVVPLPPFVLDVLFTFNIALSLLVLISVSRCESRSISRSSRRSC